MSISFDLSTSSSNKVAALFDAFPQIARGELEAEIRGIIEELDGLVKAAEPARTGQLRQSTIAYVLVEPNRISGRIKIAGPSGSEIFAKAGALEYGAHRPTKVKSHSRVVSSIFGRLVAPTTEIVQAYTRSVNIAEQDFLRGPLESRQSSILERIQGALDRATATARAT
jgi:hypothetical protein